MCCRASVDEGYTLAYLSVIVPHVPSRVCSCAVLEVSWADFWRLARAPRALAAYKSPSARRSIAAASTRCSAPSLPGAGALSFYDEALHGRAR